MSPIRPDSEGDPETATPAAAPIFLIGYTNSCIKTSGEKNVSALVRALRPAGEREKKVAIKHTIRSSRARARSSHDVSVCFDWHARGGDRALISGVTFP